MAADVTRHSIVYCVCAFLINDSFVFNATHMVSSAPNAEELARFYCGIWANDSPGEPLEGELKASAYTNHKSTTQKHVNKTNQRKRVFTKK